MLKFQIVQLIKKKDKPDVKIEWKEEGILIVMKANMPVHTHPALEKAWKKTLDTFKGESVKIK